MKIFSLTLFNNVLCEALKSINDEMLEFTFKLGDCGSSDYETYKKYSELKHNRSVIEKAIDCVALAYADGKKDEILGLPLELEKVLEASTKDVNVKFLFENYKSLEEKQNDYTICLDKRIKRLFKEHVFRAPEMVKNGEHKLIADACNELNSLYVLKRLYQKEHPDFLDEKKPTPEEILLKNIFGE